MGRITFSSATLGGATAATQAKYESLAGLGVMLRVDVAAINALGNYTEWLVFSMPGKEGFRAGLSMGDPGQFNVVVHDDVEGSFYGTSALRSAIPASGDVIIYAHKFANTRVTGLALPNGTPIVESTQTGVAALPTGAGTGAIRVGNDGVTARTVNIDAVAVFNAARSGAARYAKPEPTDADVVGLYYFGEGTGTTTADAVSGGTALTLTNNTWASPGVWDAAGGGGGSGSAAVLRRRRMISIF